MRFSSETKDRIHGISIHLELIMYGDAFLNIMKAEEKTSINWLSLCDGGDIADKGEKDYPGECFPNIIDALYNTDIQELEDNEMQVSWEVICFDQDGDQIAWTEFGNWNGDVLRKIVQDIRDIIKDDLPLQCLIDTISA